jgi:hypothetical protein
MLMTGMIVCGPWTMTFDIHDHRHRLKQLRDSGDTKLFADRDEMACPACGESFTRVLSTRKPATSFPAPGDTRLCLLVPDTEFVYLFSH